MKASERTKLTPKMASYRAAPSHASLENPSAAAVFPKGVFKISLHNARTQLASGRLAMLFFKEKKGAPEQEALVVADLDEGVNEHGSGFMPVQDGNRRQRTILVAITIAAAGFLSFQYAQKLGYLGSEKPRIPNPIAEQAIQQAQSKSSSDVEITVLQPKPVSHQQVQQESTSRPDPQPMPQVSPVADVTASVSSSSQNVAPVIPGAVAVGQGSVRSTERATPPVPHPIAVSPPRQSVDYSAVQPIARGGVTANAGKPSSPQVRTPVKTDTWKEGNRIF